MNIYKIYKRLGLLRGGRLKLIALLLAHLGGWRTIGIFFDPVMACNLRCKMCTFSDADKRKTLKGCVDDEFIQKISKSLFNRTLKFQVGCAAEPTLYKNLPSLVKMAKSYGVPYISLTTNGQLLTDSLLRECVDAGLSELTLSMHGSNKEIYEWLMERASFDKFKNTIKLIGGLKKEGKTFKLRVNYTVNADNIDGLSQFFALFPDNTVDILQIRPVQRLGNTAYDNFDLTEVKNHYQDIINPLIEECRKRKITCLVPSLEEIDAVSEGRSLQEKLFEEMTYCYVNSESCYFGDFDLEKDTYRAFHKRNSSVKRLIKGIFSKNGLDVVSNNTTKKLNYKLK